MRARLVEGSVFTTRRTSRPPTKVRFPGLTLQANGWPLGSPEQESRTGSQHVHMRSASVALFLAVAGSVIAAWGQEPATFNFNDITTQPFRLNTLETTPFGPAWADIVVKPENFLLCQGAPTALCFYSGPGPVTPCVN